MEAPLARSWRSTLGGFFREAARLVLLDRRVTDLRGPVEPAAPRRGLVAVEFDLDLRASTDFHGAIQREEEPAPVGIRGVRRVRERGTLGEVRGEPGRQIGY